MRPDAGTGDVALREQQDALAAYIRDPEHAAPPPGVEARRLRIYRELFFNNIESLLAGNFPVIHAIYGAQRWPALVRDFYREHGSGTPLFTEIARELLRYLESRPPEVDAPWLLELAHYEWVELALQISEASSTDIPHDALLAPGADPGAALLAGRPLLSPLAWPLAYAWPVHRIGPGFLPAVAPGAPTLLLLRREPDGKVSFHELSPLTYRLLQRLDASSEASGHAHLLALAEEAGSEDPDAFLREGAAMLRQLHRDGTVLGTRLD